MSKRKPITARQFLKDVAEHEMTIHLDQGLHRHVRFQKSDRDWHLWFEIVTWPGFLSITGDCGCYTFSRLTDMFEFFRDTAAPLNINLGYWGEKVTAVARNGSLDEYSPGLFRDAVKRAAWESPKEDRGRLLRDLLPMADEGHHEAVRAAIHAGLDDFWEYTLTEPSIQFEWCCWAVSWAVRQYDAAKAKHAEGRAS